MDYSVLFCFVLNKFGDSMFAMRIIFGHHSSQNSFQACWNPTSLVWSLHNMVPHCGSRVHINISTQFSRCASQDTGTTVLSRPTTSIGSNRRRLIGVKRHAFLQELFLFISQLHVDKCSKNEPISRSQHSYQEWSITGVMCAWGWRRRTSSRPILLW
jgi:hypothetical protein